MRIVPFGDNALLMQWDQKIDQKLNLTIHNLADAIQSLSRSEVTHLTPSYCSLVVGYNPKMTDFFRLRKMLMNIAENMKPGQYGQQRTIEIPVCFDSPFSLDMDFICKRAELSESMVIEQFLHQTYQVFLLGFLPGFPYLGILPKILECQRKPVPRKRIPTGSIGVAGRQTGIYPVESPGGWQIIGRTPVPIFDPSQHDIFLLRPGDEVRFRPITEVDYNQIEAQLLTGDFKWSMIGYE